VKRVPGGISIAGGRQAVGTLEPQRSGMRICRDVTGNGAVTSFGLDAVVVRRPFDEQFLPEEKLP